MDRDEYPCPNGRERQQNIVRHRALGYADNTLLAGCVLLGVQDAPEGAAVCKLSDGSWVGFYQVIPLTENELEYKIQHSTDEMLEYMEDVDHVVYFQRPDTKFE